MGRYLAAAGGQTLTGLGTESDTDGRTLAHVLGDLVRRPHVHFVRRWNWKSAVLSSLIRSAIFFATNLDAGLTAARAAWITELMFRGATAGFYGALTQAFRDARPVWAGTLTAMILLPATSHALEFGVHWLRGTPRLAESMLASVAFTVVSTSFNLFAMRRGVFIVGKGSGPLWQDLARIPRLIVAFTAAIIGGLRGLLSRPFRAAPVSLPDRTRPSVAPGR